MPYRARSGCLGGGGSEGGAPIWKGQHCVVVGKWRLSGCKRHDEGGSTLLVVLNKAGCDEEGYYPPPPRVSFVSMFWRVELM